MARLIYSEIVTYCATIPPDANQPVIHPIIRSFTLDPCVLVDRWWTLQSIQRMLGMPSNSTLGCGCFYPSVTRALSSHPPSPMQIRDWSVCKSYPIGGVSLSPLACLSCDPDSATSERYSNTRTNTTYLRFFGSLIEWVGVDAWAFLRVEWKLRIAIQSISIYSLN